MAILGMCICARTTARIRRGADKEHEEQDQKIRRQTNLCMLVDRSVCNYVCACSCVYGSYLCVSVYVSALTHGLPTRVRRHFTVLPYSPETSEYRPCNGISNGLSICFFSFYTQAFKYIEHTRRSPHQQQRTIFSSVATCSPYES